MKLMKHVTCALAATALAATGAMAEQGVTDTEVLIGSNNDLSGPFAAFGAPATKAAQMYFDEVNAAGGVHGRQIRFVVEDHGYQMPKAIAGMNKLINGDKVFAMLLSLGTPMNIAAFKLQECFYFLQQLQVASAHFFDEFESSLCLKLDGVIDDVQCALDQLRVHDSLASDNSLRSQIRVPAHCF